MKKIVLGILINLLAISLSQPLMAQKTAVAVVEEITELQQQIAPKEPAIAQQESVEKPIEIEQEEAKPTAVLSWWRSLRQPTRQDWQNLKSYVYRKYRCLKSGKGCSRKERRILATLAAAVGIIIVGTGARLYQKKRRTEDESWEGMTFPESIEHILGKLPKETFAEYKSKLSEKELLLLSYWESKGKNKGNLEKLIKIGGAVNTNLLRFGRDVTALSAAAQWGNLNLVEKLLNIPEIDVNAGVNYTPLDNANNFHSRILLQAYPDATQKNNAKKIIKALMTRGAKYHPAKLYMEENKKLIQEVEKELKLTPEETIATY